MASITSDSKKRKADDILNQEDTTSSTLSTHVASHANGSGTSSQLADPDSLITSSDPSHPANYISSLCRQFYSHGWVTGTGGGLSIKYRDLVYLAPSGVQKELMRAEDMFVMDFKTKEYIRKPQALKPSACTPLFLAAFTTRGATCCIHTHSQWAVLVTLLCESSGPGGPPTDHFAIKEIEQIKGISRGGVGSQHILEGGRKAGNLGYYDTLRIPIIENTAREEDLRDTLERAMEEWPETCAVLVRRHGVYVWGKDVAQAKTQCESLDYLFRLAVEMHKVGVRWV